MKKILGLMVACVAATVGLLSCSGGSDSQQQRGVMTMQQFYSGSKQFRFSGLTELVVYSTDYLEGGSHTDTMSETTGVLEHAGGGPYDTTLRYTITEKAGDGTPTRATLTLSFSKLTIAALNQNEELLSDLGLDRDEGDNEGTMSIAQAPLRFEIDYTTMESVCVVTVRTTENNLPVQTEVELQLHLLIQPKGA